MKKGMNKRLKLGDVGMVGELHNPAQRGRRRRCFPTAHSEKHLIGPNGYDMFHGRRPGHQTGHDHFNSIGELLAGVRGAFGVNFVFYLVPKPEFVHEIHYRQ